MPNDKYALPTLRNTVLRSIEQPHLHEISKVSESLPDYVYNSHTFGVMTGQ